MISTLTHPHRRRRRHETGEVYFGFIAAIVAILAVLALLVGGIYWAGATASAATNETCVVYSGGSFTDKKYQEILEPGTTNKVIGWGSTARCYRSDQRSYIGSKGKGADTGPVSVIGRGDNAVDTEASQLPMTLDFNLYFTLNTSKDVLRVFDRTIGIKTKAYQEDGWNEMLRDYFRPQIVRAMQNAAGNYTYTDLYSSPKVRAAYQREVVKLFKQSLVDVVKGDFFCAPGYTGEGECGDITFTVGNPVLPKKVQQAIEGQIEARQNTLKQAEENRATEKALEAERQQVALYGANGALIRQAIEAGKITFYVLPEGTDVGVPTPVPGN